MKKRIIWSILICLAIAAVLIPVNINLIDKALDKNNLAATRSLNFFSLMLLEMLILFNLVFNIINTYYSAHNEEGLLFTNKLKNDPTIPDKYFEGTANHGD